MITMSDFSMRLTFHIAHFGSKYIGCVSFLNYWHKIMTYTVRECTEQQFASCDKS